MLDRVLMPWSPSSKYLSSHASVHCCISVNSKTHRSGSRFVSNGLQKKAVRSLSDATILYSLRDYMNDFDSALEDHYFSDSEVSVNYSKHSCQEKAKVKIDFSSQVPSNNEEDTKKESVIDTLETLRVIPPSEQEQKPKTPKKRVRFADDNGLELAVVKIIENNIATMFESVFEKEKPQCLTTSMYTRTPMHYRWVMEFSVPARQYGSFREKVNTQMVSLENIHIDEEGPPCLCGSIKVKNFSFNKRVFLRVTYNGWSSSEDLQASHQISRDKHPQFDSFVFRIPLKRPVFCGERIEFAVCFQTDGREFWDSNNSENYLLSSQAFLQSQVQHLSLEANPRTTSLPSAKQTTSTYNAGCFTDFRIWDQIQLESVYY